MSKKNTHPKFYVVWVGNKPGIYNTWAECQQQVQGVAGAKYKSFESLEMAQEAYRRGYEASITMNPKAKKDSIVGVDDSGMTVINSDADPTLARPVLNSLAVDAACSGNPGVMEYQGVFVASRTQVFHFKAPLGTNNIGEFLAIVHGLAYLKKNGLDMILYSDSVQAQRWIEAKQCRTKLPYNEQTAHLYEVIHRAEAWLHQNSYTTQIRKWDTEHWGEIPADFNRKH